MGPWKRRSTRKTANDWGVGRGGVPSEGGGVYQRRFFVSKPAGGSRNGLILPRRSCIPSNIQEGSSEMALVSKLVRGSDEPVYEQIARQVRFAIGSGALPAGIQLPSVRALGSDLGINLNTVARAYRLLEEQGFVGIQHRRGVRVVSPPAVVDESSARMLRSEFRTVLQRLRQAGLRLEEIRQLAREEIERLVETSG
jgi:DNA-binding transcriptional regulator YhcF (GntR family)